MALLRAAMAHVQTPVRRRKRNGWFIYSWAAPTSQSCLRCTTGDKSVNARDRIGRGPWQNAKGEVIARTIDDLHSDKNNLNKQTALTETGQVVNGRGDKPNMHDILTGSSPEGRAVGGGEKDTTCNNWTSADAGSAIVGHHDRQGLDQSPPAISWNSSHPSKGCSQQALVSTGGNGFLYCFAAN